MCVCCVSGSQSSVFALIFVFPVLVKDKSSESETTPSEPVNRTTVSLDLLPLALSPEAVLNTDGSVKLGAPGFPDVTSSRLSSAEHFELIKSGIKAKQRRVCSL